MLSRPFPSDPLVWILSFRILSNPPFRSACLMTEGFTDFYCATHYLRRALMQIKISVPGGTLGAHDMRCYFDRRKRKTEIEAFVLNLPVSIHKKLPFVATSTVTAICIHFSLFSFFHILSFVPIYTQMWTPTMLRKILRHALICS